MKRRWRRRRRRRLVLIVHRREEQVVVAVPPHSPHPPRRFHRPLYGRLLSSKQREAGRAGSKQSALLHYITTAQTESDSTLWYESLIVPYSYLLTVGTSLQSVVNIDFN